MEAQTPTPEEAGRGHQGDSRAAEDATSETESCHTRELTAKAASLTLGCSERPALLKSEPPASANPPPARGKRHFSFTLIPHGEWRLH